MKTLFYSVVRTYYDEDLLRLIVSPEFAVESGEGIAEIGQVLHCQLALELVEIYHLMEILIETDPVVVVGTLVDLYPTLHHFLYKVSLP